MSEQRQVVVFWDAPPAIGVTGFQIAKAIEVAVDSLGALKSLKYYVDSSSRGQGASSILRSQLKCAGVTLVDTASNGRACSPAKMMLIDAFVFALDHSPGSLRSLVFVTADADICYAISLLRMRGYQAYLLCPSRCDPNLSQFALPGDFDRSLLESENQSSSNTNQDQRQQPPPAPEQQQQQQPRQQEPTQTQPSLPTSRFGSSPSLRRPSVNGKGHADNVGEDVPNVLPSHEIDQFRQRFASQNATTNMRPTLDTGKALHPVRPPRRHSSDSPSAHRIRGQTAAVHDVNDDDEDEDEDEDDDDDVIPFGRGRASGKGKEKATEPSTAASSPVHIHPPGSAGVSPFTSRSNSFDSYIMPPSVSTAPTSAMPFFGNGGGGGSKVGDLKYQSLLDSTLMMHPQPIPSIIPTANQIERSVSEGTDDSSRAATVIAAPTTSGTPAPRVSPSNNADRPATAQGTLPPSIAIQQPSPHREAVASFLPPLAPRPPLTPERIQVRATSVPAMQHPRTSAPPVVPASTATTTTTTNSHPGAATISTSRNATPALFGTQTAVPVNRGHSGGPLFTSTPRNGTTPVPATSARPVATPVVVAAPKTPVNTRPAATPVAPKIPASTGPAATPSPFGAATSRATPVTVGTPPRSSTTPVPSTSARAGTLGTTAPSHPAVPSHFQQLIQLLREYRTVRGVAHVERGRFCADLINRHPGILAAAGTSNFSKPAVKFLELAHAAGIIDSPTGKVGLTATYR